MDANTRAHLEGEKRKISFASVLVNPKYSKYQDFQQKLVLRKGIEDLTPYEVKLPDAPRPEEFINFGLPVTEQFFIRDEIPPWLIKLNRMAKQKSVGNKRDYRLEAGDIAHKNKEFREYIADKWRKRRDGIWIYIGGKPTYIPGNMWFYLYCYYIFSYGLPDFRMPDTDWWYWWNICVEDDPKVYGGIEMAMRRDGKTSRHASNFIEKLTRKREYLMGFVGRSTKDSKAAFFRAYIYSIRKLPFFFTPEIDSSREYPSSEMYFRDAHDIENGLLSRLDLRATIKTAYDGEPLGGLHLNEAGKIEEMLVTEFWGVHKECMQERGKIKGKACLESTVEESNVGGMKEFKPIFQKSDHHPSKLNERGETETGLLAYFRPSYESYVFDQYGNAIVDDPTPAQAEHRKRELLKERGGEHLVALGMHMKGGKELVDNLINSQKDPNERQKITRKYPRNIREAFRSDGADCQFNREKIENRVYDFRYGNKEVIAVKLWWENNIPDSRVLFQEVKFEDDLVPNNTMGLFLFKRNLWEYIKRISNNVKIFDNWRTPGNSKLGIVVCDPYKFDADATESDRKSMGVMHAYLQHIPELDTGNDEFHWKSDDLCCEFAYRGGTDDFDEYFMLLTSFLGMKGSPEVNSGDVLQQFARRRYDKFIYFEPKVKTDEQAQVVYMEQSKQGGFQTLGDSTRRPLFDSVWQYIENKSHKCVYPRFLENCGTVEPNSKSMTKHDYFMSGGNGIRIAEKMAFKRVEKPTYYICEFHPENKLLGPGECKLCGEALMREIYQGFGGIDEPTVVGRR